MISRTYVKTMMVKTDEEINEYLRDLQLETRAVVINCQCVLYLPDGTRVYNIVYHIPDQETSIHKEEIQSAIEDTEQAS